MGGSVYTVQDISTVAQSVASTSGTLRSMEADRREKVASYLHEIGLTLAGVSAALREGKPLDELYGAMQIHILLFTETVSDVVDAKIIEKLQSLLGSHRMYEQLKSQLDEPYLIFSEEYDFPEHDPLVPMAGLTEYRLGKLEEASGMFKALASVIRAQG